MKKLFTLIAFAAVYGLTAQNIPPQAINFQGVAIDKNGIPVPGMDELGNPIQNSAIRVRFSILTGSATGTVSYQEEHLTTTDEFGRFNLEIGRGTAINGTFTGINWGGDKHFLQVEVDLSALGTNYTLASVQEFLSVPYALYAKTAGSTGDGDTDPTNELQELSLSGNLLTISGGNTVTLPSNTDNQTLSIVGTTLTISNGNSVSIPDAQTLSLSGTNLSISNGNTISLPADSDNQNLMLNSGTLSISGGNSINLPPNTDNQTLSISANTISISNGNSITLPASLDNDSTNELQTLSISNGMISISNGNSVQLPLSQGSLFSINQECHNRGTVFSLPSPAQQALYNVVIGFHDSIAVIQSIMYWPDDTIYYRHNYKNNSTGVLNVPGKILHSATSDSLLFLQSLSAIYTINIETGSVISKALSTPFVDKIGVDHKTKTLYSSCGVANQSTWRIYRFIPANNSLSFITLSPLNNRTFEVINSDTLNIWPTNAYLKFSTNSVISTITPAPLSVSSFHKYLNCYVVDNTLGRNNLRRHNLNYVTGGGQSIGYSDTPIARKLESTNNNTYMASINYTSYNSIGYLNNLTDLRNHYILKFNLINGNVEFLYKNLTQFDHVKVTDKNLLLTINRPVCVNGLYYSDFILIVE